MSGAFSLSMREYDATVAEAYRRLFPDDPEKSPEFLDWRFRRNPHGPGKFSIACAGAVPVGMIAFLPTRLRNGGRETQGYQAIDTCVDESARGGGLFVKMGMQAQDPIALGGDLFWGFPNANAAPGWYGRLGWTDFGPVPLLMRPLRSSFVLKRLYPGLRRLDLPLISRSAELGEPYISGDDLAADFDRLWNAAAPHFGIAVNRSGPWMRWRLFEKPVADYRCVGIKRRGELDAFVATRLADKHGGRLCYIMEAIGLPDRPDLLARLIRAEIGRAARAGAEVALAWCPRTAPNYRAYRRAGFYPVPPRIRPIEINFGARALRAEYARAAAPGAQWYVSFLDSDTN